MSWKRGDKSSSLAPVLLTRSASRRCGVGTRACVLRSLWGWDREPGRVHSRTLPSTCPAAGSPGPGRDRSLIGGRGLLFSFLLSQTNTSEVTHRNGHSLPSFFLPRGFVSWGAACREAVGSKDRNNILWLAVSYRVKTTPSSRQLDPLWPSSKSPKRGLSLELQVTAASLARAPV